MYLRLILAILLLPLSAMAKEHLPQSTTVKGEAKFQQIARKAVQEQWHRLPIETRMVKVAKELEGIPYKAYTLEIHNHIESPSIDFTGLDCWTFFEACLAFSRMLEKPKTSYTAQDLLKQIEWTRYRDGRCNGNYLDRIHYLVEWYEDNDKRKNIHDLTQKFPTEKMDNRCQEMSQLWKSYRYLKHNPHLRAGMAKHETRLTNKKFYMIPKHKVAGIESQLKNGDIIGIARHDNGSYCSHVGIIIKDSKGRARFMHASTTYKKVVIDSTISEYLKKFKKHAGILVARPR